MKRSLSTLTLLIVATSLFAADPIKPFNGKNLDGWTTKEPKDRSKWVVGTAKVDEKDPGKLVVETTGSELINASGQGVDGYTLEKFGDCTIKLEVMVPKGSNSGVYVMGEYEVQIFDSFGKERVGAGDIGGLYGAAAPKKNAAKKPGEWQTMEIIFEAPKFDGEKKVSNAKFVKVVLNGETIHENVEMKGPTPSGVSGKEAAKGPLMFQGDHGPVAYRNIEIWAN
jgi:hypothetical protein